MLIQFVPQRSDMPAPALSVTLDTLTINGESCDLAAVQPVGARLPGDAIASEFLLEALRTLAGLEVRVLLPIGPNPTPAQAFPAPVTVASGAVALPEGP